MCNTFFRNDKIFRRCDVSKVIVRFSKKGAAKPAKPAKGGAGPPPAKGTGKGIPIKTMENFLICLFDKFKLDKEPAKTVANMIIDADSRGYYPHGVFRIPSLLCDLVNCTVDPAACPQVVKETECTALVDGKNALGPIVGAFSMNVAMKKAKKEGAGAVGANHSNYFGPASFYTQMAMKNDLIGLALSNTPPMMLPFGGKCAKLGANPFAFGTKSKSGATYSLDIASSKMSKESVEWHFENKIPLPPKVAMDGSFKETKDANVALEQNKFLPFGDLRGYGFGLAVEILSGVMTGANYGHLFNKRNEKDPLNIGHLFIALDPKFFYCEYSKHLDGFVKNIKATPKRDAGKPIRVPGDVGFAHAAKAAKEGIVYNKVQLRILKALSDQYELDTLSEFLKDVKDEGECKD